MILVLVIIAIMLAVAAPTLSGWGQGRKLDNAVDQFLAATRWAQSQAIADAQLYAISIDPTTNSYVVQVVNGDQKSAAKGEFGQTTPLPTGFTIAVTSGGGSADNLILFQPDARCTPATLRIASNLGDSISVAAASPAEPFAKVVAK